MHPPATPCLLLDEPRMERNLARLRRILNRHGVALRPHVKTCKNVEVARRMVGGGASPGITVSTLAEAEAFFGQGFDDQVYAVGIGPGKLDRAAALVERGLKLKLILDHPDTATALRDSPRRPARGFDLLLEIDADGERAGLRPDAPALLQAAGIAARDGHRIRGVLTHMGGSYGRPGADALRRAAELERAAAVEAADRLRAAGHACDIVSVGSTPTAHFAERFDGVTEVRAGVHVFMDLVMAGLDVCGIEDIALSVLTEVIGYRDRPGEWLIDAGWMALSRDRGTAAQPLDQGYGMVLDADGDVQTDLIVRACNQERGIVARRDGAPLAADRFRIGQRLRILPNHACATAAQHDEYWLLDSDGRPGRRLDRIRGW